MAFQSPALAGVEKGGPFSLCVGTLVPAALWAFFSAGPGSLFLRGLQVAVLGPYVLCRFDHELSIARPTEQELTAIGDSYSQLPGAHGHASP